MATVYRAQRPAARARGRRQGHSPASPRLAGGGIALQRRGTAPWRSSATRTSSRCSTSARQTSRRLPRRGAGARARPCASSCRSTAPCRRRSPASLGLELLGALAHAHAAGVVHRDIKPENVSHRLHRGLEADVPWRGRKLTDFGIAKLLDAQGVTSTGQVLGSPAHMAPEQIEGATSTPAPTCSGRASCSTSAWSGTCRSKGATRRRCCAACSTGGTRRRRPSSRPSETRWSAILDRALAHAPSDRFADASAMRDGGRRGARSRRLRRAEARARGLVRRPGLVCREARAAHD